MKRTHKEPILIPPGANGTFPDRKILSLPCTETEMVEQPDEILTMLSRSYVPTNLRFAVRSCRDRRKITKTRFMVNLTKNSRVVIPERHYESTRVRVMTRLVNPKTSLSGNKSGKPMAKISITLNNFNELIHNPKRTTTFYSEARRN